MRYSGNPVKKFLRRQLEGEGFLLSGLSTVDNGLQLKKGSLILFKAEAYSGGTSLCLEYAAQYSKTGLVFYVDSNDVILPHRLHGINVENFVHIRPTSTSEALEILSDLAEEIDVHNVLLILDNPYILPGLSLSNFLLEVKRVFSGASIMLTDRLEFNLYPDMWHTIVTIKETRGYYIQRLKIGHFISILHAGKTITNFVEYKTGRLSRIYNYMLECITNGATTSSVFTWNGQQHKGFWTALEAVDSEL